METKKRTVAKAISWQLMGLLVMTAIGWLFTGSAGASIGLALMSAGISFVTYFLHERVWQRVTWGRAKAI